MIDLEEEKATEELLTDSMNETLRLLDNISFDSIRPQYFHLKSLVNTFIILRPRLIILIENETNNEKIEEIYTILQKLLKIKNKICIDQIYRRRKKTPVPPDLRNHMEAKIEQSLQEAITNLYNLVVFIPTE